MNKTLVGVLVAIIVIGVIVLLFIVGGGDDQTDQTADTTTPTQTEPTPTEPAPTADNELEEPQPSSDQPQDEETVDTASVTASDQSVEGETVEVDEVAATENGFVVIHETDENGEAVVPESIGDAQVSSGVNGNVAVELDQEVAAGENLVAMLHVDSNNNGEYEFGPGNTEVDTPVTDNDDEVVTDTFAVQ